MRISICAVMFISSPAAIALHQGRQSANGDSQKTAFVNPARTQPPTPTKKPAGPKPPEPNFSSGRPLRGSSGIRATTMCTRKMDRVKNQALPASMPIAAHSLKFARRSSQGKFSQMGRLQPPTDLQQTQAASCPATATSNAKPKPRPRRRRTFPVVHITHHDSTIKFSVKASVALEGKFDKWRSTLVFTSPDVTTGVLDIKIEADSVDTGSGMKDTAN